MRDDEVIALPIPENESGAFPIIALVVSFVSFCFWVAFFLRAMPS